MSIYLKEKDQQGKKIPALNMMNNNFTNPSSKDNPNNHKNYAYTTKRAG